MLLKKGNLCVLRAFIFSANKDDDDDVFKGDKLVTEW